MFLTPASPWRYGLRREAQRHAAFSGHRQFANLRDRQAQALKVEWLALRAIAERRPATGSLTHPRP